MTDAIKLKLLLEEAIEKKWCASVFCTTCGCLDLRKAIKSGFTREEILSALRGLDQEFIDIAYIQEALEVILHDISLFGTGYDLVEELKDTPVGSFLNRELESRRADAESQIASRQRQKEFELYQRQNRLDAERLKAQKNIWNALKRKDIKAIEVMISKGIDLDERNAEGKSIKELWSDINGNH